MRAVGEVEHMAVQQPSGGCLTVPSGFFQNLLSSVWGKEADRKRLGEALCGQV